MDTAVSSFDSEPQLSCDSQFAVFPDTILGFITLGETTEDPGLPTPSTVIWKPSRLDYAPDDEYPWLPAPVRETCDRSGPEIVQLRWHHILVRPNNTQDFFYAGEAHMGSFGGPVSIADGVPSDRHARFTLQEKLPRDVWLRCGGYQGWEFDVNHEITTLEQGDMQELERLLDKMGEQEYSHLSMTRYEEDTLSIHTNTNRAWLMYEEQPANGCVCVYEPELGDNEEHFQCVCGISLDFPASQTVSHKQAKQVAEHFFLTGELSEVVRWDR